MLASFVPRPVLRDETVEDQQNVIEEMVDEKVECHDDDDDAEELEGLSAAESGSSYTVHPSGQLTLVFRNSPLPGCSPAHSPAAPSADFKLTDALRNVRVKLERCDDADSSTATPSKRSRMEVDSPVPFSSQDDVAVQRLKCEVKSEVALSEADVAVAGLLGSSSVCNGEIATDEAATDSDYGQLSDGLDRFFADGISPSAAEFDLKETAECFAGNENGVVVADSTTECDTTADCDGGAVTQMEACDVEVTTAVDSLMADLIELNAEMPNPVRTFIPNGSVYLPSPVTKLSLVKRTLDPSGAVTESFGDTSLRVTEAVPSHLESSLLQSSQSSPFSNQAPFVASEHEPDLDAAIKSILS